MTSVTSSNSGCEDDCAKRRPAGRFAELHAGGIDCSAAVVCELQLNGYVIERV